MGPRGTQKGSQNREKNRSGAQNDPKLVPGGSIANVDHSLASLGGDFWVPQGTPESTKKSIFGENGDPRAVIFSIFARKGAATHLFIDFSSIFG